MVVLWLFILQSTGVMCMTSSCTTNPCPGDDITFTCRTSNTLTFTWLVTDGDGSETACVATTGTIIVPTCGPMDVFSVNVSGNGSSSTLSAQSVDDTVNGTSVLCGDDDVDETICVIDPVSPPTNLSVECNSSSAVVSFQPPVYGGKCVDYYMVSAVSEEASAPCDNISTSDGFMFKCSIPPNSTVNFTVYSVHSASDSRSIATDSCPSSSEMTSTYESTPHPTPDADITTADADITIYIAAGVGGAVGLLVIIAATIIGVALVMRKKQSKHAIIDPVPFGGGDELKILGMRSQASIEERRYEPPTIAAPPQPQTESTAAPDVVPAASGPLYEDLNTLTAKEDQVSSPPPAVYHVLEGPTPDWENRTKQTKIPDIPVYSVVDKTKKKKNRSSPDSLDSPESSNTADTSATPVYSVVDKSKKRKNKSANSEASSTTDATANAPDIPVYSVVDKSKKKKNRSSATTDDPAANTPVYSVVDKAKKKKNRSSQQPSSEANDDVKKAQ